MEENKSTIKVLFIAINTSDKPNEYWEDILNNVKTRISNIKEGNKKINFEFIIKINISPHDLCDIIRDEEPDILHFQGHGEEAGLMFSDENDKSVVAYGRGIRDTLRALSDPTRKDKLHLQCILFNCCYQYNLAEDLLDYTCFAIGTASELEIDVAKSFAASFYSNLCRGDSYKQAYELGKAVVNTTRKSIPIQNRQILLEGRLQLEIRSKKGEMQTKKLEKNINTNKTLNKVSAATRAQMACEIASRSNWEQLGLQFEKELGKTFSRRALAAEQGEHAPPINLVQHLIEKLAAMLLSVSSFKAALVKLDMPDIAETFAKELE
jgi:hypothetical protein